jgi:DNA-binding NarL/FixJ family response regulator
MDRPDRTTPIRVALVEDDLEYAKALANLLNGSPGWSCAGTFSQPAEALRDLPATRPDVVLMDIVFKRGSGIDCVRQLKTVLPHTPILMLTTYEEIDLIFDSLRAGADGYLLKRFGTDRLQSTIKEALEGGAPMSRPIARKVIQHFHQLQVKQPEIDQFENLTPRELEVLKHLADGFMYKEIASKLGVSTETIRVHVKHIYKKLHVTSRTAAAVAFLKNRT